MDEPCHDEGYTTYRLRPEMVETHDGKQRVEGYLLIRVYHGRDGGEMYRYGERLRLEGRLWNRRGSVTPPAALIIAFTCALRGGSIC